MNVRDAARNYRGRGWWPLPIKRGQKGCLLAGWADLRIEDDDIDSNFPDGVNIGILLGDASGGLIDIDLDNRIALEFADKFLPATDAIFGRPSKPRSHRLYRITESTRRIAYEVPGRGDDRMLVEIRGNGCQTNAPPSIHVSDEEIAWSDEGGPATVSRDELQYATTLLAIATLIALNWPNPTSHTRNDLALALAGGLISAGLKQDAVEKILRTAVTRCDDEEADRRVEVVAATVAKYNAGKPIVSWPKAEEILGVPIIQRLRKWAGDAVAANDRGATEAFEGEDLSDEALTEIAQGTLDDVGNCKRLKVLFRDRVRYVRDRRAFFVYEGGRWLVDGDAVAVTGIAKTLSGVLRRVRLLGLLAGEVLDRFIKSTGSYKSIRAAVSLVKDEVMETMAAFDNQPYLLNVANGTIDVRTGRLNPHNPKNLLTKIVPVDYRPGVSAPTFDRFLREVLPDAAVREFLKRFVGYASLGLASERVMVVCLGDGRNGKSVLLKTLVTVLGEYGDWAAPSILTGGRESRHPTEIADLFGKRLVVASEVGVDSRFDVATLKQITGRDNLCVRRMREDFWSFTPTHVLMMAVNHLPTVDDATNSVWDRLRVIPFDVRVMSADEARLRQPPPGIPVEDPGLYDKLVGELSGILNWVVEGAQAYLAEGLTCPDAVKHAGADYRAASNPISDFVEERCELGRGYSVSKADMSSAYHLYVGMTGGEAISAEKFGRWMKALGCGEKRTNRERRWNGVRLRALGASRSEGDRCDNVANTDAPFATDDGEDGCCAEDPLLPVTVVTSPEARQLESGDPFPISEPPCPLCGKISCRCGEMPSMCDILGMLE